jgi:hypothetical protein
MTRNRLKLIEAGLNKSKTQLRGVVVNLSVTLQVKIWRMNGAVILQKVMIMGIPTFRIETYINCSINTTILVEVMRRGLQINGGFARLEE